MAGPLGDYLRDPAAIYRESFERIRREAALERVAADLRPLTVRLIHACGMTDIVADLAWTAGAVAAGGAALADGAPILVDAQMVAAGIQRQRLPAENRVICTLHAGEVAGLARELGTTRSAAAVELWREHLPGAVIAIGNAPTALFRLLEVLLDGRARPALILAFPVGFVGAAEAKEALIEHGAGLDWITLRGRRGGSALAAAAINALLAEEG